MILNFKHLHTYSLTMPALCLSIPFMHLSSFSKHKYHKHKNLSMTNIYINIYVSGFFLFLSMSYKLDYALKT